MTLPSVSSEMLQNQIGYIRIESFEEDTAQQFEEKLADLQASGMQALVVDLRYNGGGLVDSVVQILDDILPEGLVVYVEDKYGNRQEYNSDGDTYLDCPLAVLINGDSASASEIFAGAVKDYEYGTLIGTTTFGKGLSSPSFRLRMGMQSSSRQRSILLRREIIFTVWELTRILNLITSIWTRTEILMTCSMIIRF